MSLTVYHPLDVIPVNGGIEFVCYYCGRRIFVGADGSFSILERGDQTATHGGTNITGLSMVLDVTT